MEKVLIDKSKYPSLNFYDIVVPEKDDNFFLISLDSRFTSQKEMRGYLDLINDMFRRGWELNSKNFYNQLFHLIFQRRKEHEKE